MPSVRCSGKGTAIAAIATLLVVTACDQAAPDIYRNEREALRALSSGNEGDDGPIVEMGMLGCPYGFAAVRGERTSPGAPARDFQWTAMVPVGGVFPSARGMVENAECHSATTERPRAGLYAHVVQYRFGDLSVEPGHVIIPLTGEATLDGVAARAYVDAVAADAGGPAVTIAIAPAAADGRSAPGSTAVYRGLRPGGAFAWGGDGATIVRIIDAAPHEPGPIGWVEVRLSGAPPSPPASNR